MGRPVRTAKGGVIYHTLNRANAGLTIFACDQDYASFEGTLREATSWQPMRLLAYCLLPDHFHLLLWPRDDGDLSHFMRWLTLTHTQRWHLEHGTTGCGHLYQGRFKSFPVQPNEHFLTVCRYVERSGLPPAWRRRAEEWRWGSLWQRHARNSAPTLPLSLWPVASPTDWTRHVNGPLSGSEEGAVERSIRRGQPFGGPRWQARIAKELGLGSTFRPRGRPRKNP